MNVEWWSWRLIEWMNMSEFSCSARSEFSWSVAQEVLAHSSSKIQWHQVVLQLDARRALFALLVKQVSEQVHWTQEWTLIPVCSFCLWELLLVFTMSSTPAVLNVTHQPAIQHLSPATLDVCCHHQTSCRCTLHPATGVQAGKLERYSRGSSTAIKQANRTTGY